MSISESIISALRSVYSHKMRSILTMLGIIIGIGSVIMITSVGDGVRVTIFDALDNIDRRVIQIFQQSGGREYRLTFDDAEAIARLDGVEGITMITETWGFELVRRDGRIRRSSIAGLDGNYNIIERVDIQLGRFIDHVDVENHLHVAVITPQTAFEVFGFLNVIGEQLELEFWGGSETFTIIGVLAGDIEQGAMEAGMAMGSPLTRGLAVIPLTTLNDILGNDNTIDFIGASVTPYTDTIQTAQLITTLLDIRHGTEDYYFAQSMEAGFELIDTVFVAVTAFVAFVAGISLFVGGVGVMNIMLVTVKERTREIGVRKSLGATEGNIKAQFMLEAVTLTFIGGGIGITLGFFLAGFAANIIAYGMGADVYPVISLLNVSIAFLASTAIGLIFGVYPASKAAKLDPIEALRYE